jgi:Undecaprenyl-phosphate galactose phosphotransferase WbaP
VIQPAPSLPAQPPVRVQIPFPRLLDSRSQRVKRVFDVMVALALGIAALPLAVVIAAAIVIESGRPVFFLHTRVGRGRRRFRVVKFRSMVQDAGRVLEAYLAGHPERAAEWQRQRKLKNDPRVTRVGRLLRRTSLDELPQIWNILRGEMSVVGPRPITDGEIPKYGAVYSLYSQIAPGLTGLWQVSGRNDTSYHRRVVLDACYVRTWTPILDLIILLKTIPVVLAGKGAY